jgi:hypothetical protein
VLGQQRVVAEDLDVDAVGDGADGRLGAAGR